MTGPLQPRPPSPSRAARSASTQVRPNYAQPWNYNESKPSTTASPEPCAARCIASGMHAVDEVYDMHRS